MAVPRNVRAQLGFPSAKLLLWYAIAVVLTAVVGIVLWKFFDVSVPLSRWFFAGLSAFGLLWTINIMVTDRRDTGDTNDESGL